MLPSKCQVGDESLPPEVTAGRWTLYVVSLILILGASVCLVNYRINIYGCYGDVRGKSYRIWSGHDERNVKYLLSMNYVPSNFDGLLLGSSVTDNWSTRTIQAARVYNCSISGGNISEAKLIADNVLRRKKLRVVLFLIFPYFTESGGLKGGAMGPHLYWEALGSFRLLVTYEKWIAGALHLARNDMDDYGMWRFVAPVGGKPALWAAGNDVEKDYFKFAIDPVACRDYKELIGSARANGALLVRLRVPISRDGYETHKGEFLQYYDQIDSFFAPADPLIDFNGPAYDKFRGDRSNFIDGVHLTSEAASVLIGDVDEELRRLMGLNAVAGSRIEGDRHALPASSTGSGAN